MSRVTIMPGLRIEYGGRSPREVLQGMMDDVQQLYNEVDSMEGNASNVSSLKVALIDVMSSLDIATSRAGRV